jgi:hypothetical protein
MLFTGDPTIFAIIFFIERFKWCNSEAIEKTHLGIYCKFFSSLFTIILEIHSVEDRVFD